MLQICTALEAFSEISILAKKQQQQQGQNKELKDSLSGQLLPQSEPGQQMLAETPKLLQLQSREVVMPLWTATA